MTNRFGNSHLLASLQVSNDDKLPLRYQRQEVMRVVEIIIDVGLPVRLALRSKS